jgi:hypothetical protein
MATCETCYYHLKEQGKYLRCVKHLVNKTFTSREGGTYQRLSYGEPAKNFFCGDYTEMNGNTFFLTHKDSGEVPF